MTLFLLSSFEMCFALDSHGLSVQFINKERKAPKRCTLSLDHPKTSVELNCSVEMRMAKGAFSIHSLSGKFLLLGK